MRVGVAPAAPDRIRPIEVWEHRDVEELRAGGGREDVEAIPEPRSSSSGLLAGGYAVEPSLGVSARRSPAEQDLVCHGSLRFV